MCMHIMELMQKKLKKKLIVQWKEVWSKFKKQVMKRGLMFLLVQHLFILMWKNLFKKDDAQQKYFFIRSWPLNCEK